MGDYATICELRGKKPFSQGCTALTYIDLPYCALRARARRNADDPQYNCLSGDIYSMHYDGGDPGTDPGTPWVLRTGVWNDNEPWDDYAFWKDTPDG